LVVFESFSDPVTCAANVDDPAESCPTTTVTVALAPFVSEPKLQTITGLVKHCPLDAIADTIVPVDGGCAVNTTLVAPAGPAFVTVAM
jgi:hypothetical protein